MWNRHVWARLYHQFSPLALDRQKSAQTLLPTLCQSGNEPAMLTSLGWLITIAGHSHLSKVLQNSSCYFTLKSCRHFGTKLKSKPPFLPRTCSGWLIIVTAKSLPIVWIQNCNVGRAQRVFSVNPVAQIEFCCGFSNFDGSGQWCEEKQLRLVNFDMN